MPSTRIKLLKHLQDDFLEILIIVWVCLYLYCYSPSRKVVQNNHFWTVGLDWNQELRTRKIIEKKSTIKTSIAHRIKNPLRRTSKHIMIIYFQAFT